MSGHTNLAIPEAPEPSEEEGESNRELMEAFASVLIAERIHSQAATALAEASTVHKHAMNAAEARMKEAWDKIAALMQETGEYEVKLPGSSCDYRISYTQGAESVKIPDAAGVPDEFAKMERVPKKAEIAKHLKALREQDAPMPNWATLERGENKLGYKVVKKALT